MNKNIKDKQIFWANNLSILFDKKHLSEFFPDMSFSLEKNLNSIVRLSMYISLLLFVFNKNYNNIYYGLITMAITYLIHLNNKEKFDDLIYGKDNDTDNSLTNFKSFAEKPQKEIGSTPDNPYGNILLTEYGNGSSRKNVINYKSPETMKKVKENFNINLYKDINDVFGKNNSQRQFMSNPIQTIPNNREDFTRWCYSRPITCKEGNGNQCVANNPPAWIGNTASNT